MKSSFLEHMDTYCPKVGGPVRRNWDSSRCPQRFHLAEFFPDNECQDCGVYLRAWLDNNVGGC